MLYLPLGHACDAAEVLAVAELVENDLHLCGGEVRTLMPTRGFWIRSLMLANRTELSVWDVGGRRDVRGYWRAYYSKVQSLIFVIDAGAGAGHVRSWNG